VPTEPSSGDEIEPYSKHPSELRPYEVCPEPSPGHASCLAVGSANPHEVAAAGLVVPQYEGSGVGGGFSPADLLDAYNLPSEGGEGMTVAVTIAYDDPKAEEDLGVYRSNYGLPACTTANGCFKKLNQQGKAGSYPATNADWALETSLDLDMVSAACPKCHIILVEANSNTYEALEVAVETAAAQNPAAITDSWGGGEFLEETTLNHYFEPTGIPILFSSGDFGYGVEYPASAPGVVAVGGTSLTRDEKSARGWGETTWPGAGSGCSAYQKKPSWQEDGGCSHRTIADVSAVADPSTPVSIYDSFEFSGWGLLGGTSVSSPLMAGVEAQSSASVRAAGPSAFPLLGQGGGLFDPTEGRNGSCGSYLCEGGPGYDGPTGWGTPDGPMSFRVAVTETATLKVTTEATLHGSVDPRGLATQYQFEYGETIAYGTTVPVPAASAGSGSGYVKVAQTIAGLKGQRTYHYRLTAINTSGTFHGLDREFGTTAPTVATQPANVLNGNEATLNGTVNPNGNGTRYWFEYGTTTSYGSRVPIVPADVGSGNEVIEVDAAAILLRPETTYHFRVVAQNFAGTSQGEDKTLTTPAANWKVQIPSGLSPTRRLTTVSCPDQEDCIVLGEPAGTNFGAAGRWHAGEWSTLPSIPEVGKKYTEPTSLSCATDSSCVAVGFWMDESTGSLTNYKPLASVWDGKEWNVDPLPLPAAAQSGSAVLRGVSCVSSRACTAVGLVADKDPLSPTELMPAPMVQRWDGEEWSLERLPVPQMGFGALNDVSCSSLNHCVAVGYYGGGGDGWHALIEEWDGEDWSIVEDVKPEGSTYPSFGTVSCVSSSACMVLGELVGGQFTSYRWNGETWTPQDLPMLEGVELQWITGLSCASANACQAVGGALDEGFHGAALSWDGSNWTRSSVDRTAAGAAMNQELSDVSCATPDFCMSTGADAVEGAEHGVVQTYDPRSLHAYALDPVAVRTVSAGMRGRVGLGGLSVSYQFEYGEDRGYGQVAPASLHSVEGSEGMVEVEERARGLEPATEYHYRLRVTDGSETSYSEDMTFTTRAVLPTWSSSFGKLGTSPGQLNEPLGLAIDSVGDIWVADTENNRIQKFSPTGELRFAVGGKGTGNGQFNQPYALAVDSADNVWVADTFNSRIQEFNSQGEYLTQFGGEGVGNGQFTKPYGLALSENDDIWVADSGNNRIEHFNAKGEYKSKFAVKGSVDVDLAVDANGNIWTVEYSSNRVTEYDSAGNLVSEIGTKGKGTGQFETPTGLGIDQDGNIWVADSENDRVQEFSPSGSFIGSVGGPGAGTGQLDFPRDVAFDGGDIWIVDSYNNRIQQWSYGPTAQSMPASTVRDHGATLNGSVDGHGKEATYQFEYGESTAYSVDVPVSPAQIAAGSRPTEVSARLRGLNAETTYHYRIMVSDGEGISYGQDTTFTTGPALPAFSFSFGTAGSAPGQFQNIGAVAVNSSGAVWVSDSGTQKVSKFESDGTYVSQFGSEGTGNGQFWSGIEGLAVDSSGNLLVSDTGDARVQKFNSKGEYLSQFGGNGSTNGRFVSPSGIAIDASGNIYVVDTGNDRVQKFNSAGEYLSQFGSKGSGNGKFDSPFGIAIDASGNIYVVDTGNGRVQKFNSAGEYLSQFARANEGGFNSITGTFVGIAIDANGVVYVSDSADGSVQLFSGSGAYRGSIGELGGEPGQIRSAGALAVGTLGELWVADFVTSRVEKWSAPSAPQAVTEPATEVERQSATLNGNLNPGGREATYYFEYGPTTSYGSRIPLAASASVGSKDISVSQVVNGLSNETTYHYRLVARSEMGVATGADKTLTTLKLPKVTTEAATSVKATQATLNATINPEATATSYYFEYGATTSYGTKIPTSAASVGSGTSNVAVAQTPTGFSQNTTYHYRVVATNSNGISRGADKTFTTLKLPKAITEAATDIGATQATLHGTLNPTGFFTIYYFEYGPTTSYGGKIPAFASSVGTSDIAVSQTPSGLSPGTSYHFRLVAESYTGTEKGEDKTFTTSARLAFALTTGSYGSGNGQFENPMDVAVDSAGNFWVAELHRVQKFNSKGEYQSQFGSFGTGNGQFEYLTGIAIDGEGNVWTVDRGSAPKNSTRVQKFNSKGEYSSQFGSYGTGNGQFHEPQDLTIDPSGNVWVADTGNSRVQEFNSKGEYLRKAGSSGSGDGQFGYLTGIAADSEGAVWTVDGSNSRVEKFNSKGEYVSKFGSNGTGNGQFNWPWGISVDPSNDIWIVEQGGGRIQGFNSKGEYLTQFGSNGFGAGKFHFPYGIAAGSHHEIYVADTGNSRIQKLLMPPALPSAITQEGTSIHTTAATLNASVTANGLNTSYQFEYGKTTTYGSKAPSSGKAIGSATGAVAVEDQVTGLETGTTYHYRVVASNEEGTTYGADRTFKTSVEPYGFARAFGSNGKGILQFADPTGLSIDSLGNIWVIDSGNSWLAEPNRIEKFNSKGEYLTQVGSLGSANGQFNYPTSIAADPNGNVWVADFQNLRIQEFNSKGAYLRKIELETTYTEEEEEGVVPLPILAVDAAGNLWMADGSSEQVRKFSPTGESLSEFSTAGHVSSPIGLSLDVSGNLWIADSNNHIVKFNSKGEYQSQFGSYGSGNGQFKGLGGIDIDASGNIWVSDAGNCRIQEFNSAGVYQRQFGSCGYATGQLDAPAGVAVDSEGSVWVVDKNNSRVQEWRSQPPTAVTLMVSGGEEEEPLTLEATINPHGRETQYQFEYGTTSSYGSKDPASPASAGSGDDVVEVGVESVAFKSGVTYHYRVTATNDAGTSYGKDVTFVAP
jgi:sugar lactone lactonase YvrE/phosphodiesterase/alkaline phosphatase D-like protein